MAGKVFAVGVGPGDPELMTFRAVRVIAGADVVAVPGDEPRQALAYRIASEAVPELLEKELVAIPAPMVHDRALVEESYRSSAARLAPILDAGRDIAFITIGDPTVYCTFFYLRDFLAEAGYEVEIVSGVPSFCAAAARAGVPVALWDEQVHIIPGSHCDGIPLDQPGTYVLMKSGSRMAQAKQALRASGRDVRMVENCGLPGERVYRSVDEIPDDAGYFSLIIAREV